MAEEPTTTTPRRTGRLVAIAVAVVALAGAGFVWWWVSGDEPAEVDLAQQVAAADADGSGDDPVADADAPATDADGSGDDPADLAGTWVVDTTSVPFDGEAGTGTFVGYRVDEELTTVGAFTAVGRTPDVMGEVVVADDRVVATTISADLTTLQSDSSSRDGRVRSTLGPDAAASFVLADELELDLPAAGEVATTTAVGALTILDTTRDVEVALQTALIDGSPVVGGRVTVLLSDFGVTVPSAPIVVSASDEAVLEWQLYLARP